MIFIEEATNMLHYLTGIINDFLAVAPIPRWSSVLILSLIASFLFINTKKVSRAEGWLIKSGWTILIFSTSMYWLTL